MKEMKDTDYRKRLYDYLRKNMAKGYDPESLKWALVSQGYSRNDIDKAINDIKGEIEASKRASEEKPIVKYEVFDANNQQVYPQKPWWKKIFFWMD